MSELTSGEKAFIGLMTSPIVLLPEGWSAHTCVIIGATVSREFQYEYASFKYSCHPSLDLSQITSVNMFLSADGSSELYWVDGDCKNIMVIEPRYTSDYNFDNVPVPSDAKGIGVASYKMAHFQITSFTTKDGKVHTADNLNY